MDRQPQQQTERSRRSSAGVTLVTTAMIAAIATAYASSAMPGRAGGLTFPNPGGVIGTIGMDEADAGNPFFQELGTNGRTCATCHQPAQGWSITPAELRDRFERTAGLDPIFRTNDGSNCEGADVSTDPGAAARLQPVAAEGADSHRPRRSWPRGVRHPRGGGSLSVRRPADRCVDVPPAAALGQLEIPERRHVGRPSIDAWPGDSRRV